MRGISYKNSISAGIPWSEVPCLPITILCLVIWGVIFLHKGHSLPNAQWSIPPTCVCFCSMRFHQDITMSSQCISVYLCQAVQESPGHPQRTSDTGAWATVLYLSLQFALLSLFPYTHSILTLIVSPEPREFLFRENPTQT